MEGKGMLLILITTWFWWSSMCDHPRSDEKFQSFLRNKVDESEIITQISGPNGYCMDVKNDEYPDENHIILWDCKSSSILSNVNQLWSFDRDRRIRSNGKCLTANPSGEGSYVMIFDCDIVKENLTIWESKDGVIMNTATGLVLTASPGTLGTQLTVETNIFSSFQTWRVSNNTKPWLVSILGLDNLCLQLSNNIDVWVDECDSSNEGQQWLLYSDGTIRPDDQPNPNQCLSYNDSQQVIILPCGVVPSRERWLYTDSGTILNENANLVLDVKQSDPSLKEILAWDPTGEPNQKWSILPPLPL